MTIFNKKFFAVINILAIIYIIGVILFATNFILTSYNNLSYINNAIEKEREEILDKYKKIITFVLKNNLPKNINYFSSISNVTYGLPLVKEFKTGDAKDMVGDEDEAKSIRECYKSRCLKVRIDEAAVLNKIGRSKLWQYGEITAIPLKKITLLKMSIHSLLVTHRNFFTFSLFCLFGLYLFQSIFLFRKNLTLAALFATAAKNNQELIKKFAAYDMLCNSAAFSQDLISEYFTHYVHQLVTREICREAVDFKEILLRVEKFFSYQITKKDLTIVIDDARSAKFLETDKEILFIILLNLIFKAVFRSKISSQIGVKIFQIHDTINVGINDLGYEYQPKLSNKIQIYGLPEPILEKLCQKIGIETYEVREGEANFISLKLRPPLTQANDNIIKLNLYGKKN